MSKEVLRLQFVNVKNCFLHFPAVTFNNFSGPSVCALKLEINGRVFYFSPSHSPNPTLTKGDLVGINPLYAKLLGFKENDIVVLSSVNNLGSLKQIQVSPSSEDDYEILLSASDAVEFSLLNQLRIVWPQQVFCAWVAPSVAVTLVVDSVSPNLTFGRLEEYSEVIVGNVITRKNQSSKEKTILPPVNIKEDIHDFDDKILICRSVIFHNRNTTHSQPYVISLSPDNLPEWAIKILNEPFLWSIQKLYDNSATQSESIRLQIKLDRNMNIGADVAGYKSLFISTILKHKLGLENGTKVILKPLEERIDKFESTIGLLITPYFEDTEENIKANVQKSLFQSIVKNGSILINSKGEFMLSDGRITALTLRPLNLNWSVLKVTDLNDLTISVNKYSNESDWPETIGIVSLPKTQLIRCFENILFKAEVSLVISLGLSNYKRNPLFFDNLLLTGSSGSGKTTLGKCLMDQVQGAPYYLYSATLDCHQLRGKRIEILAKQLLETLNKCFSHQPAVLFLDNVDLIAGAPKMDLENSEATLHLNRVAYKIIELIEEYQKDGLIALVATAESVEKINENLFSRKKHSLFTSHIEIPQLSKDDRFQILKLMIADKMGHLAKDFQDIDLNTIANQTEGYVASDLFNLLEKALFESSQRKVEKCEKLRITNKDLEIALNNSKPSLLHGINLTKHPNIFFSNIGGLNGAKEKLTEIILWPLMYPEIMNQCPLKAQNAVLLYGMPGTGKTLLANAIAGESKLNFITVKGPELMSKYIGQSEEEIRKVFEKAQAAKPCLLFFDEFDSLAPKRGQEQTGVTDRVVNQLLTALDGVQPLTGVSVLAATSRPDLIDKALLRPGRIGSSVYCSLPDEEERLAILKVLCKNIPITDEVNLMEIAKNTVGFTGADLKGLITTAQIKLIDNFVEESLGDGMNIENILPSSLDQDNKWSKKVDLEHFTLALNESKPSLNIIDRLKFEQIYTEYQNPSAPDLSTLKVTFA